MAVHVGQVARWVVAGVAGAAVVGLTTLALLGGVGTTERVLAAVGAAAAVASAVAALYPVLVGQGSPDGTGIEVKGNDNRVAEGTDVAVGDRAAVTHTGPGGPLPGQGRISVTGDGNRVGRGQDLALGEGARVERND